MIFVACQSNAKIIFLLVFLFEERLMLHFLVLAALLLYFVV